MNLPRPPSAVLGERVASLGIEPPEAAPAGEVTLLSDVGPLVAHATDDWITPTIRATGSWEPDEATWLRRAIRPGDVVLDVGAHVGYFTRLASLAAGPWGAVLAVEPDPANLALLRANVGRGEVANVVIAGAAASDRRGLLALHRSPSNTGGHEVREQRRAGEQLVPAVPLDLLLGRLRLDVCKIDAQGHDHRVLAGLRQTLGRNPQARVLVEFWLEGMETRGLQPRDVLDGYRALGRPLGLLDKGGAVVSASDEEILAAAEAWKGRFVDLVLGRRR